MSHPLHLLLQVANHTLTQTWEQPVQLSKPQLIKQSKRALIFRCRLDNNPEGIPSVVLKYIRSQPDQGFCEWASLEFLSQLPTPHHAAPRFYGGDPQAAFLMMADMGPGFTLHDILQGQHPEPLPTALHHIGTTMARLQMATQGHEAQLQHIQRSLPPPTQLPTGSRNLAFSQPKGTLELALCHGLLHPHRARSQHRSHCPYLCLPRPIPNLDTGRPQPHQSHLS